MTGAIPISVVVPVRNEEANLAACLEALGRFEEVIVVDSNSTDTTPEIARAHGAQLLNFKWDGRYPKKRNWVLLNQQFECDWVLFLDADEIIDDAFCEAVVQAIENPQYDGYWLNYTNHFLSTRLDHGLPQRKLAMFRLGTGLYERIEEDAWSALDMEIHEHPVIEGELGEIKARIDHRDFRGLCKFLDRHTDYAMWEASRLRALEAGGPDAWNKLTSRQQFKYRHVRKWWYPWFYFLYAYGGKLGFLDGAAGFHYAFYKAWYFLTIRLLLKDESNGRTT